jgi:hypothetical protein
VKAIYRVTLVWEEPSLDARKAALSCPVLAIANNRRSEAPGLVEDELRRPRVDAECVPDRLNGIRHTDSAGLGIPACTGREAREPDENRLPCVNLAALFSTSGS